MLVFLSHSSKDKPFVRRLDAALREMDIDTFLDERDIMVGQDIPQRIHQSIEDASHVLYVISTHSVRSEWVKEELSAAKMQEKERQGVFILPLLVDEIEVPSIVSSKRYADFREAAEIPLGPAVRPFRDLLAGLGVRIEEDSPATNGGHQGDSGCSRPEPVTPGIRTLMWLRDADRFRLEAEANNDIEKFSEAIRLFSAAEAWDRVGAVRRTVAELLKAEHPRSRHVREEFKLAAEAFRRGSEFHNAGLMYEESGLFPEAASMFDEAESFLEAAKTYEKLGDWQKAAERFSKALFALEASDGNGAGQLLEHFARMYERAELWRKAASKYSDSEDAYKSPEFTWRGKRFSNTSPSADNASRMRKKWAEMCYNAGYYEDEDAAESEFDMEVIPI